MTFWLEKEWQANTANEIQSTLQHVHRRLAGQERGGKEWTVAVLQAFVPVARGTCGDLAVCGLECPPDERCKGEWLYDFSCWVEGDGPGEGFLGLPIAVESEWGAWKDVWDDLDKLTQSRAGLRVFIFDARWAPPDWHTIMSRRIRRFTLSQGDDAWLFAGWLSQGFDVRSGLAE